MKTNGRIHTCLWFNGNAEAAARYYTSIFPNARITHTALTTPEVSEASGIPLGTALTLEFELDGHTFLGLNGGPAFKFNEAISLMVQCKDQAEIDHYWNKLGEGGPVAAQQCGWVKDKFGVSWQVVPIRLGEMAKDKDQAKVARMMAAVMGMKKLVIADLESAFSGEAEHANA